MTRVLVCGGRDFAGRTRVRYFLDDLHARIGISVVITGMAGEIDDDGHVICGADLLAWEWANLRLIETMDFPVTREEWLRLGKSAGPRRNRNMLRVGRPDMVVAFPGGKGTRNMTGAARNAGVPVVMA